MATACFEQLPDEILLLVFKHLLSYDILMAFSKLNGRLDKTIRLLIRGIDLTQDLSMTKFQHLCTNVFPFTCENIHRLTLSNEYAPNQMLLLDQGYTGTFPNLRCLTLTQFTDNSVNLLLKMLKIRSLRELTVTNIEGLQRLLSGQTIKSLEHHLLHEKHELEKLEITINEGLSFCQPIKNYFNIKDIRLDVKALDDLFLLFELLPNLKRLRVCVHKYQQTKWNAPLKFPPDLTQFHLETIDKNVISFTDVECLLKDLKTLEFLSIDLSTIDASFIDGLRWESILKTLPKIFKVKLLIRLHNSSGVDCPSIERIFSSNFWLNKLHTYVSCYASRDIVYLDTMPYYFLKHNDWLTTSIFQYEAIKTSRECVFKRVYRLSVDGDYHQSKLSQWFDIIKQFPLLRELFLSSINIPEQLEEEPISCISVLPHVRRLHICRSRHNEINLQFFGQLLRMLPNLCTLNISYVELMCIHEINLSRITHLEISLHECDGQIQLDDVRYLSDIFPNLKHLKFTLHSHHTMKRGDRETILRDLLNSFNNLISFEMLCSKDLKFHFLDNHWYNLHKSQLNHWLDDNVSRLTSRQQIYKAEYAKKYFVLWL
ncbi:unnamed protein product [Didymodactylos carnosus]|uniref:F-box domain-containing protein n=1 Tax=Didymodactylos carnosus TaxID=1234261 RepID=A0A8S2K3A6_9BILA|nr:unnamed protein product [Didymodactylos carnosus]CAF3835178.1 unnamed protein product [Didymodactylos carnosus]